MKKPVYQHVSILLNAMTNCLASKNPDSVNWANQHESAIEALVKSLMPSGSGIDCGTKLLFDESNSERLVFAFSFHHMNDNGMYDGWTEHKAVVTPSLQFGYNLKITGRDRNGIKEYLHETFAFALDRETKMDANGDWIV